MVGRDPSEALPRLAAPAQRALAQAGIASLGDLGRRREADVAALRGVGPGALAKLRLALARRGLAFAKR